MRREHSVESTKAISSAKSTAHDSAVFLGANHHHATAVGDQRFIIFRDARRDRRDTAIPMVPGVRDPADRTDDELRGPNLWSTYGSDALSYYSQRGRFFQQPRQRASFAGDRRCRGPQPAADD